MNMNKKIGNVSVPYGSYERMMVDSIKYGQIVASLQYMLMHRKWIGVDDVKGILAQMGEDVFDYVEEENDESV